MLSMVVHGESGVGKTWLTMTAPAPRLVLDVEGRTRFAPTDKRRWNPIEAPPKEPTETTLVLVQDFATVGQVYQWLATGQHPFKSVCIDSLSELQKRCMDEIVGTRMPETQDWGTLLRKMESVVRHFRDLLEHPSNPLDFVGFIAMSEPKDGKMRPYIRGQLVTSLPFMVDVMAYMYVKSDEADTSKLTRHLLVQPREPAGDKLGFAAKDGTDLFGAVVSNPNITDMVTTVKEAIGG